MVWLNLEHKNKRMVLTIDSPEAPILSLENDYIQHRLKKIPPNDHDPVTHQHFIKTYSLHRTHLLAQKANKSDEKQLDYPENYLALRASLLASKYGPLSKQRAGNMGQVQPVQSVSSGGGNGYQCVLTLKGIHRQSVTRIRFAGGIDEGRFISSSLDSMALIYDIKGNTKGPNPLLLRGHQAAVTDCSWSNNDSIVVTCSLDKTIRLWDSSKAVCLRSINSASNSSLFRTCDLAVLNNNMVITGTLDGNLQVYNLSTGKMMLSQYVTSAPATGKNILFGAGSLSASPSGVQITAACTSEDSSLIFLGDEQGFLHIFNFDQMNLNLHRLGTKLSISTNSAAITGISYTPHQSKERREPLLLIQAKDNHLRLFKFQLATLPYKSTASSMPLIQSKQVIPIKNSPAVHNENDRFMCVQPIFARNLGKSQACHFACGSEDGNVHVFEQLNNSAASSSTAAAAAVSPAASGRKGLQSSASVSSLSSVNTGENSHQKLSGHACPVLCVAFSHDRSFLILGDSEGILKIWHK